MALTQGLGNVLTLRIWSPVQSSSAMRNCPILGAEGDVKHHTQSHQEMVTALSRTMKSLL